MSTRCCARILLSVLRTLLHGAFPWLQPRSPVDQEVAKRGRGPDPPDARVEAQESARLVSARAVRAKPAAGSRHAGKLRPAASAVDARLPRVSRAGKPRHASARVVAPSLPWLA